MFCTLFLTFFFECVCVIRTK
uniref:Uncharacterized protein n=1 Tax=Anguilla anguilla TaxID=7936 RepID=A0A0E9V575_ANGAN